jgi:large subunit ribosomal protein L21
LFAIVETGGFQFRVEPGSVIEVPRIRAAIGEKVRLAPVLLLVGDDGSRAVGTPHVESASAEAEVVEHNRGMRVLAQRYRRRKAYRKVIGSKAHYTKLRILGIAR